MVGEGGEKPAVHSPLLWGGGSVQQVCCSVAQRDYWADEGLGIGDASRHQATTEPQYQPCLQARQSRAAAIRMHSAK
jgi:hypothetical protein